MRNLVFIFTLVVCGLTAQENNNAVFSLRPAIGLNGCQIHGDSYDGYNKLGVFAGASVNARINEKVSLELGFYFSQKGAKHNPNPKKGDLSHYNLTLNYVELPLTLRYMLNKRYFVNLGPSLAYLVSYHETINYTDFTGVYHFNPYEIALVSGLGRQVKDKINVEVRFTNSIRSVRDYGIVSTVFYPNPVARFFNKGFYNNILTLLVTYNITSSKTKSNQNVQP